jgi:hypothetical protein
MRIPNIFRSDEPLSGKCLGVGTDAGAYLITTYVVKSHSLIAICIYCYRLVPMKLVRMLIMVPESVKERLDALRAKGYTASGYIRHVLEREFNEGPKPIKKGG